MIEPAKPGDRSDQARAKAARADAERAYGDLRRRQEALLDEAVEETFPASDPVAVVRLL